MKKSLYVLISKQLNPIYGCVQGGHAVAQWLLDNKHQDWNNQYLIYLAADLDKWLYKLTLKDMTFSTFYEPDLDGTLTAIAIYHDGSIFRNLKLIGS